MNTPPIVSGSMIGILGSGQLGRMLALVARQMGYRVAVFSPGTDTPTGQIADLEVSANYDDLEAVREFAQQVDVLTYEFENVPVATALAAAAFTPVHPQPNVLSIAQNRIREKSFFVQNNIPVTPFAPVHSLAQLHEAATQIGLPAILKTAESGYDGKGQARIDAIDEIEQAWHAIGQQTAILEKTVDFTKEISVVVARAIDGQLTHYGVLENDHYNHILDTTISPATVSPEIAETAIQYAKQAIESLDAVGVICVEFFVTAEGMLLANEFAPRPHNSGHLTIESHLTSQFEQQLRAVCGLALGSTRQLQPAAMVNLLGDLWTDSGAPEWGAIAALKGVHLHLYGKDTARPGRKMGHLTVLDETAAGAKARAQAARDRLRLGPDGVS